MNDKKRNIFLLLYSLSLLWTQIREINIFPNYLKCFQKDHFLSFVPSLERKKKRNKKFMVCSNKFRDVAPSFLSFSFFNLSPFFYALLMRAAQRQQSLEQQRVYTTTTKIRFYLSLYQTVAIALIVKKRKKREGEIEFEKIS